MSDEGDTFYGKYRGKVETNIDPIGVGRLQVSVPDVLGDGTLSWAMPCLPGAGPGVGIFVMPPVGANVWVEFERGDPDYPVWTGGFWDVGDQPAMAGPTQPGMNVWAGDNFHIEVDDNPGLGALTIEVDTAAGKGTITIDGTSMELSFASGSIKLDLGGVSVNGSNLQVLPE